MAETAAHLVDHVFPRLPVRQWVLSLPKRLRYFLRHDARAVTAVLKIFLRVVEQVLRERSPGRLIHIVPDQLFAGQALSAFLFRLPRYYRGHRSHRLPQLRNPLKIRKLLAIIVRLATDTSIISTT
jgi:hypothetical protein